MIKTEEYKVYNTVSDHVEVIDEESILKVICKRSYDDSNIRACLGVHIPTETKFDKVFIKETKTLVNDEEAGILTILYGLEQALKVAKCFPKKYKQIDIFTGIQFLDTGNTRKNNLLNKEIDDFIDNLKPIKVKFKLPKLLNRSINEQAYKMIRTELQNFNVKDSKDNSIEKRFNKVENDNHMNEQSSR